MKQNSYLITGLFAIALIISGCGKEKEKKEPEQSREDKQHVIVAAINNKSFQEAEQMLSDYIKNYPDDPKIAAYRLMLADVHYELENYETAYDLYNTFGELYPVDQRAEYAAYKSAHAMFAQSHGIACDATPTERTIELCENYQNHPEYLEFRGQMEDLEQTCKQRLLEKDFYVANSYLNQNRLQSAQHRLDTIEKNYELKDKGGRDRLLFYRAQLAKKLSDSEELEGLISELHELHPQSQFTAMADRLQSRSLFG